MLNTLLPFETFAKNRRRSGLRRSFQPAVESLETRIVPATFIVDTVEDVSLVNDGVTSLREAIQAANDVAGRDIIEFDAGLTANGPAQITLMDGPLVIRDDLNILGPGSNQLAINGDLSSSVFQVGTFGIERGEATSPMVFMSGLTITDGAAFDGGGIFNLGTLTLSGVTVSNSHAVRDGGAIYNANTLSISNSDLSNNSAGHAGGGIYNAGRSNSQADAPDSEFDIDIVYLDNSFTPAQRAVFELAAQRWEQAIVGDLPGINLATYGFVDDVVIEVRSVDIDGAGGTLARAAITALRTNPRLAASGRISVDIGDLDNMDQGGRLFDVVLHEIGHVLGVGLVWTAQNLLTGAGSSDPRFTGAAATAEYNILFGNTQSDVPVENTGGGGTQDSHWRETVFGNELMTGFNNLFNPLSSVTIASLEDIGYEVNMAAADPFIPAAGNVVGSTLRITNSSITDNTAGEDGGGIFNNFSSSATLVATNVLRNRAGVGNNPDASEDGGGIFNAGTMNIQLLSMIADNRADDHGGGIFNSGILDVRATTISGNLADSNNGRSGSGGGVYNSGSALFINSSLSANEAFTGGGIFNDRNVTLRGSEVLDNRANVDGGGVHSFGLLTVTDSTVSGNRAGVGNNPDDSEDGGGIASFGALSVTRSDISNNRADDHGGGVYSEGALTIRDSTLSANIADGNNGRSGSGGAIYLTSAGLVTGSTLSGNRAFSGGGVFNSGNLEAINVTISGNTAVQRGGGLENTGATRIVHGTIVLNRADSDGDGDGTGGGIFNALPLPALFGVRLDNSIVAGNLTGAGGTVTEALNDIAPSLVGLPGVRGRNNVIGDPNSAGGLVHGIGGNFVGNGDGSARPIGLIVDTTLRNNGGLTMTHGLVGFSPALDMGDSALSLDARGAALTTDQRGAGFDRIGGTAVDVGAFENHLPIITGPIIIVQPVADSDDIQPFRTMTIDDADNGIITVVIVLSNPSNGVLTNLGGFTDLGNGVYRFVGLPADATTATRGLIFLPTPNQVPVGDTVTTMFTVTVDDGIGASAVENRITVVATSVNDAPSVAAPIPDVTVRQNDPNTIIDLSGIFTDPDVGDSLILSVVSIAGSAPGLVAATVSGSTITLSYGLHLSGAATITVRATDESGAFIDTAFSVTILSPQQQIDFLLDHVEDLGNDNALNRGLTRSLTAKLENAIASLDKDNTTAAVNLLYAFLLEVSAYVKSQNLTAEQGQLLVIEIEAIIRSIG